MSDLLGQITANPVLAFLGALVVIALVLVPVFLRLAGLSGAQIIELVNVTWRNIIDLVHAFREENKG